MASLLAHVVKRVTRFKIKRRLESPERLVAHLRVSMAEPPFPPLIPKGVRVELLPAGPLRGEALRIETPRQAVLYLHGGGYIAGHPRVYRNLCARLAKRLDADVFVPEYRLAPEHPFPAALEDALAAYKAVLARGFSPNTLTVMGDSAGGGLTLALLLALREQGEALPKCAAVFSPLADLRLSNPSIQSNCPTDAMLSEHMIMLGAGLYPGAHDVNNPLLSPALGEYTGLCPLFVSVCEAECLRDDAYAVVAQARRAGINVEVLSRPDLLHVWPIFIPLLPEAREDFERIVSFIGRHPS